MGKRHFNFKSLAAILALALLVSGLAGCASGGGLQSAQPADGKLRIVTTIAQIAEPLAVIGGDRVNVESLMGPGVDPHLYQAAHSDIQKLAGADAIFYNGLHLEANMTRAFEEIGKSRPVIAIAEVLPEEKLLRDETGAVDPHVWFDIDLWKEALAAATEQLKQLSAEDAEYFEASKKAYFARLDALKEEAAAKLAQIPKEKRILVTAHDAFGYFGRFLDLEVVGLQGLSTETEVSLKNIEQTVDLLVQRHVPAVFVESSINPDAIQAVIEGAKQKGHSVRLGGELFSDAMGAAGTEEGTYIGMYRHNVEIIYQALSGKGES
jgi:manganese/zinc/iron transport system substrate-binding protein